MFLPDVSEVRSNGKCPFPRICGAERPTRDGGEAQALLWDCFGPFQWPNSTVKTLAYTKLRALVKIKQATRGSELIRKRKQDANQPRSQQRAWVRSLEEKWYTQASSQSTLEDNESLSLVIFDSGDPRSCSNVVGCGKVCNLCLTGRPFPKRHPRGAFRKDVVKTRR